MKIAIIAATALMLTACGSDTTSPTDNSTIGNDQTTDTGGTGGTGTDTGGSGTDTGGTGTDTGSTGTDTGGSGTDTGSTGNDTGGSGTDTGSTGTDTGGSGTDTGSTGTDTGGTGTDTGGTGTDTGGTDTGGTDTGGTGGTDTGGTGGTDTGGTGGDTGGDSNPDIAGTCSTPPAGSTIVSKTTPVLSNDNPDYYNIMGPQCVVPGSQYDGPGLAFGDFLMINNAWNGQQSSWNWQQCIALTAQDGSILPSWTYDWGNEDDLQPGLFEWEVKSYPEIIYGAKSNDEISAPCAATGLPRSVKDLPEISIAYNYRAQQTDSRVGDKGDEANNPVPVTGGDRNIALESFFHSSCSIQRGSTSNMELELMVWLEVGNERLPSGSPPVRVFTNNAGQSFDVYNKPGTNNYIAYVAKNTVRADTLQWNEFINDARNNAASYNIRPMQDSWCLANIIFGSEIWWGEGSVNLDYYQITSRY